MIKTHLKTPDPDAPNADTPNNSYRYYGSADSYIPYSLSNHNKYCKIALNTKYKRTPTLIPPTLITPMMPKTMLPMPLIILTMMLLIRNLFIFPCKIAITKSPPTPKKNKNNTTPNTDVPDASDNDSDHPYSLCNRKNKKKNMTPNIDEPKNYSFNATADDDTPQLSYHIFLY